MGGWLRASVVLNTIRLVENYIGYARAARYGTRFRRLEDEFSLNFWWLLAYPVYVPTFEERDGSVMTEGFVRVA